MPTLNKRRRRRDRRRQTHQGAGAAPQSTPDVQITSAEIVERYPTYVVIRWTFSQAIVTGDDDGTYLTVFIGGGYQPPAAGATANTYFRDFEYEFPAIVGGEAWRMEDPGTMTFADGTHTLEPAQTGNVIAYDP